MREEKRGRAEATRERRTSNDETGKRDGLALRAKRCPRLLVPYEAHREMQREAETLERKAHLCEKEGKKRSSSHSPDGSCHLPSTIYFQSHANGRGYSYYSGRKKEGTRLVGDNHGMQLDISRTITPYSIQILRMGCIAKRRTTGVELPGQGSMMHERTGIKQGKGKGETRDERKKRETQRSQKRCVEE